jgi:hypothetical protein
MGVTEEGKVCAFYVVDGSIKNVEIEIDTFVTLVATQPRLMDKFAIDLANTPLVYNLLKNLDKEGGAPFLREGAVPGVWSSAINELVVNSPHFVPEAPWRPRCYRSAGAMKARSR